MRYFIFSKVPAEYMIGMWSQFSFELELIPIRSGEPRRVAITSPGNKCDWDFS